MEHLSKFDQIISILNLRNAWIKAKHHAQTDEVYFDKYAYETYGENLEAKLISLQHELKLGVYRPNPLRFINIPKKNTVRKIYFLSPKDAIVIQAVINVIGPEFEKCFSEFSFGNRLNIDRENKYPYKRWQDQYSNYISEVRRFFYHGPNAWYLITDIKNYYPSISIDRLNGLIASKVQDEKVLRLFNYFLSLQAINLEEELEQISGLPAGPIYAHFFANIYLDEFDTKAVSQTLGYARYVDDICMVCQDKDSLSIIESQLIEFLKRWNQEFKIDKTQRHSIKDRIPLLEHTRRMKYAMRLDFVEILDVQSDEINAVSDIEKPFSRLYRIAERDGDLEKLASEASTVIRVLREQNVPNLKEVIYSLLALYPLNPSTLRVVLACLLEIETNKATLDIENFFDENLGDQSYIRINLLQILEFFIENINDSETLKNILLNKFTKDNNYIVRANTYLALKCLIKVFPNIIHSNDLNTIKKQESSTYALQRLIDIYSVLPSEAIWLVLRPWINENTPTLLNAVGVTLRQLIDAGVLISLETLWPAFIEINKLESEISIQLIYLASLYGQTWMLDEVIAKLKTQGEADITERLFSVVSQDVIEIFAKRLQLSKLLEFSEYVGKAGFASQARLGLDQVIANSEESALQNYAQFSKKAYSEVSDHIGLPDWINDISCTRVLYRENNGATDYVSYKITSKNKSGILELISKKLIEENGFENIKEWENYLEYLQNSSYIPNVKLGKYVDADEEKVFCIYEIPDGFYTLADLLEHQNFHGLLPHINIFKLGSLLIQFVIETKKNGFSIKSIDPLNTLWNPTKETIGFLNIGSSLGIASYQCGESGCLLPSSRDEIGDTTASYYIGLLLLQLLNNTCPLKLMASLRNDISKRETIYDLVDIKEILPHFRSLLGRMLQPVPDYRYANMSWLQKDYAEALEFAYVVIKGNVERDIIMQSYLRFRLQIISRNPNLFNLSTITRANSMLNELSKSLNYLPEEMISTLQSSLRFKSKFKPFASKSQARHLSPESRRLAGISQGWEELTQNTSDGYFPSAFAKLCLYRSLSVEISACMLATVLSSSSICAENIHTMNEQILSFMEKLDNSNHEITIRLLAEDSHPVKIPVSQEDLLQLQSYFDWFLKDYESDSSRKIESLKTAGLLLLLLSPYCQVELSAENIFSPIAHINLGISRLDADSLWIMTKDFSALDNEIKNFQATCTPNSNSIFAQQAEDAWLRVPHILDKIRNLNPAQRCAAEVYSYQIRNFFGDADGVINLTFPKSGSYSFNTSDVFISGDPSTKPDSKRPIRVDLVKSPSGKKIPSSILAPIKLFLGIPFPKKIFSISKFATRLRKNPRERLLLFCAIGIGIPSLILWALSIVGLTFPAVVWGVSYLLGTISLNMLSNRIEGFLSAFYPEESEK